MDLICDLDGTVWQGNAVFPGVSEAIARTREAGHRVLFATNNAIPAAGTVVSDLERQGIAVDQGLVSSAMAMAAVIGPGQRAFVIGGPGMRPEIIARGGLIVNPEPGMRGRDLGADVVAVGRDVTFTFTKLALGMDAILAGARFLAIALEPTHPGPDGLEPGSGPIVAALANATGVEPEVVGKPSAVMVALLDAALEGDRADAVVIGDSPASDGGLAAAMGIPFAYVGCDGAGIPAGGSGGSPDYVAPTLVELLGNWFT